MSSIFSFFSQGSVDLFNDNTDFPIGSIIVIPAIVSTNSNYSEWLLCNGISISKTDYSNLYAVIGDTYGSTTNDFNIPDLSNYAVKGCNADEQLNVSSNVATTATLSKYKSHTHSIKDVTSTSGVSNVTLTMQYGSTSIVTGGGGVNHFKHSGDDYDMEVAVDANSAHTHSISDRTSTAVGSTSSFAIKPTNILMAYYIKS